MTPRRLSRFLARVLPLLVLSLVSSNAALGQPAAPGPAELAPEMRERLAQAAENSRLAPWQRDVMLRLARTGEASARETPAADLGPASPTLASGGAEGEWEALSVPARVAPIAIYDPMRDRMVVFGGDDGLRPHNDVWALSLAGTPAWTRLAPSGTPPSARERPSAIYDPVRDRMVVFGGWNSPPGSLDDVWALSLAETPAWTQLTPTGTPPSARSGHSAIYDPVRDRMVVFGGWNPSPGSLNDVWAMSLAGTPAWTQLAPTGTAPSARSGHSAIYDPVRDRMVVYRPDVWAMSLAGTPAWTQLVPTGTPPSARAGPSAIYDPVRDRMLVFGGVDYAYDYLNDVWAMSLTGTPAWTQLTPTGTPPSGRDSHSAIYDPVRDRMVVFGGEGFSRYYFNDVWSLSLAETPAWTQPIPSPPSRRSGHSAIYDPMRDRMVVFGGMCEAQGDYLTVNDVWSLSLAGTPAWTQVMPTGTPPSARWEHSAIYDPVRDRMVVFGGGGSAGFVNDVWALSLAGTPAWTQLVPTGTPPSTRSGHSAIYDPVRDRMVAFGGSYYDGSNHYLNDVWTLSLAGTPAWTQLTPASGMPNARSDHSAIYNPVRDCMVVFGGFNVYSTTNYLDDVCILWLAGTPAWTEPNPPGTLPTGRYGHGAIYDPVRERMVVFGGAYGGDYRHDVWSLPLAGTPWWSQLAPSGTPPSERFWHSAIYDPVRVRMVVFGGYLGTDMQGDPYLADDVWALGWSAAAAVDHPSPPPLISGLRPPAPNPARGMTTVCFTLAQAGRVRLGVYDASGRLVRRLVDGERRAGTETVIWNGTADSGARMGAGVYFVRLAGPGFRETRRVVLLR